MLMGANKKILLLYLLILLLDIAFMGFTVGKSSESFKEIAFSIKNITTYPVDKGGDGNSYAYLEYVSMVETNCSMTGFVENPEFNRTVQREVQVIKGNGMFEMNLGILEGRSTINVEYKCDGVEN